MICSNARIRKVRSKGVRVLRVTMICSNARIRTVRKKGVRVLRVTIFVQMLGYVR